jgi:hypothetical protein
MCSTTADLIGGLAMAVGEQFAVCFQHFWRHIAKYYKPTKPVSDRSMAIGIIGEVASGIKKEVTPMTKDLLQLTVTALSDVDEEVRSNAAFATGAILYHTQVDLSAYVKYYLWLIVASTRAFW